MNSPAGLQIQICLEYATTVVVKDSKLNSIAFRLDANRKPVFSHAGRLPIAAAVWPLT